MLDLIHYLIYVQNDLTKSLQSVKFKKYKHIESRENDFLIGKFLPINFANLKQNINFR